ncbi:hypothetical protein ACJX0J_022275, partial [Zea mays]
KGGWFLGTRPFLAPLFGRKRIIKHANLHFRLCFVIQLELEENRNDATRFKAHGNYLAICII